MNYGDEGRAADLKFALASEQEQKVDIPNSGGLKKPLKWKNTTNLPPGIEVSWEGSAPPPFSVKVKCLDYGAYGPLAAELHYGGILGVGTLKGRADIKIPRDDNTNWIADGWEKQHGMYTSVSADAVTWSRSDDESGPLGNSNPGDGLSIYEEYRGFIVQGAHIQGDPTKKDLFIYSNCDEGIGYASALPSTFVVHQIREEEMGTGRLPLIGKDRRIDYKGENVLGNTTKQKALRVEKDDTTVKTSSEGTTLGETDGEGPPYEVGDITIYYVGISQKVTDTTRSPGPAGQGFRPSSTDITKVRSKTIGHEVGHGTNVIHHDIIPDSNSNPDPNQRCIVESGFSVEVIGTGRRVVVGTIYRLNHPYTTPKYNHAARFKLK